MDKTDWIGTLLERAQLPLRSQRQYRLGMAYWVNWHRFRYGTPLPLSELSSQPVAISVVDDFVEDHSAVTVNGQLRMRMRGDLYQRLRDAGYNAGVDCVSPRTIYCRVEVLKYFHRLADVPFDRRAAFRRRGEVFALWEAERAALGVSSGRADVGDQHRRRMDGCLWIGPGRCVRCSARHPGNGVDRRSDLHAASADLTPHWENSRLAVDIAIEHPVGLMQGANVTSAWDEDAQRLKS